MSITSIWRETTRETDFPCLEGDLQADVAIVGGGITGVTLAMLLADAGKSVVLLEARRIGAGATGDSTGNLYEVLSHGLQHVRDKWDRSVMRAVVQSRREAVDMVERTVDRLGIDCGFQRCALHLYATAESMRERVEREYRAAVEAGVAAELAPDAPLGLPGGPTLVVENQAQFHPLAYVRSVTERIASDRCRIFEQSPALEIDADARKVRTARGSVSARELVLATHTPKGFYLVQAEMLPQQEYGVGVRLARGPYPQGIYWGAGERNHSVRSMRAGGAEFLIAIGDDHKTGQHDAAEALARVEDFVCRHFDVAKVDFRWSAQNFPPADGLPYIGRSGADGPWIATGFGSDGLTYGTLAATLIGHRILGHDTAWAPLYRADRFVPVKAARGVAEGSMSMAKAFIADRLAPAETKELLGIPPGGAAIVELHGEKAAVYRDEWGAYSAVSPVCTHMKCLVRWNAAEQSWDCPCHGSRFDIHGCVIEGPAIEPLARKTIE